MNVRKSVNIILGITLSSLILISCSTTSGTRDAAKPIPVVAQDPLLPVEAQTTPADLSGLGPTGENRITAPPGRSFSRGQISKDERSVFFTYDNYSVSSDYDGFLLNVASDILGRSILGIRVEGNTDSRGSRAYNMALGQQRAESVKKSLVARGVPRSSISTISFGKERLLAPGNDEESHAINRRADILFSGEY